MLDPSRYTFQGLEDLPSPSLLFFEDIIKQNTDRAIAMAGGTGRLWPHVKTHKMREMVRMQADRGIRRFKCATLVEARMTAESGGEHILIAYPLVGPNLRAFVALEREKPDIRWYALGDDAGQLAALSEASVQAGLVTQTLLDLNLGMDRTGAAMAEAEALYRYAAGLPGLSMVGLHAYDGHRHEPDIVERTLAAGAGASQAEALRQRLEASGIGCKLLILGGTPTFPIHAGQGHVFLSPGTLFVTDWGYYSKFQDLPFVPAAAVFTRVISRPGPGLFTLDAGTKAIASEMPPPRGHLLGWADAKPVRQSEEHMVLQAPEGKDAPKIGTPLLLFPNHICPTTALHAHAWVIAGGRVIGQWAVAARDR